MVPAALMDQVMTIFCFSKEDDRDHLRDELLDVLAPWWAAMEAMVLLAAEEGLPDAASFEI